MLPVKSFLNDTSGAVTVDWVVLTAGLVGLGLAASAVVSAGVGDLSRDIDDSLSRDLTMVSRFGMNRMSNASFEDIEGMLAAGWGFYNADGSVAGWNNINDLRAEITHSGYQGVTAADGNYMLDLEASPGNIMLGQQVRGAITGQTYTLTFNAADPRNNNGVEVYWGGDLIKTVNPTGTNMQSYSVQFQGGAGDGSNMLMIGGTGPRDNVGAYIDNIEVSS
jgi:hypothetical protein